MLKDLVIIEFMMTIFLRDVQRFGYHLLQDRGDSSSGTNLRIQIASSIHNHVMLT